MNNSNFSFLEYLNNKGLYYKTNVIEEFLLNLKMDHILFINGAKGIGKTSLAKQYVQYYNIQKKLNKNISSTFTLGKTTTSKGFAVKRIDTYDLIPHMKIEDKCYCIIDDIKVKGHFNILPRFFFKPKENEEFKKYLLEEKEKGTKSLNCELILNEPELDNILIANADNFKDINNFIKKCEVNKTINHFLIFDNVNDRNIQNILFKRDEIPTNLIIIYTGLINDISRYNLDFSVINIHPSSPIDYLQNNMENVNLKDVSYLEKPDFERINDINKMKIILQKINIDKKRNVYNTILDELNNLYFILNEVDIVISNQIINDILNYIIIGWKYENKPEIFENWKKYYDSQLSTKIIPLVENNPTISDNTINNLIKYCNNEYNYYRSYNIITNIKL